MMIKKQPRTFSPHGYGLLLLLLILCIFISSNNIYTTSDAAAAATSSNQEEGNYEALQIRDEFAKVATHSSGRARALEMNMEDVMGSVEVQCDDDGADQLEEECMKRRLLSEAHLDYIYTQHHKP